MTKDAAEVWATIEPDIYSRNLLFADTIKVIEAVVKHFSVTPRQQECPHENVIATWVDANGQQCWNPDRLGLMNCGDCGETLYRR